MHAVHVNSRGIEESTQVSFSHNCMAAQGNETSYRRVEGESTQWEDIQRKLGNFAPKPKPEAGVYTPHIQPVDAMITCNISPYTICASFRLALNGLQDYRNLCDDSNTGAFWQLQRQQVP